MNLIDTHSHAYSQEFDADRPDMVRRAENEGIKRILMPAIDSTTHDRMNAAELQFPRICTSMMGVHPCSIKEDFQEELLIVEQNFQKRQFIAVGETGLDFYWDLNYVNEQRQA